MLFDKKIRDFWLEKENKNKEFVEQLKEEEFTWKDKFAIILSALLVLLPAVIFVIVALIAFLWIFFLHY